MYCRNCKGNLTDVISLGDLYVSTFVDKENIEKGLIEPIIISICDDCSLVQLKSSVDSDLLYRRYWYLSGINPSMYNDLRNIYFSTLKYAKKNGKTIVLDIGCNDCTLLGMYNKSAFIRVGFDPAKNIRRFDDKYDYFINDYFSAKKYKKIFDVADIITAIAMFYDLDNPNKFLADVKSILDKKGVFIIQLTTLTDIIDNNMVDSFCHEHLIYYRSKDIVNIVRNNGLEVFDIERNNVNGGSTRYYIGHPKVYQVTNEFNKMLEYEEQLYSSSLSDILTRWYDNINSILDRIIDIVYNKFNGEDIYALGASTKGNTLLQLLYKKGLDMCTIKAIGEINIDKFGLYTIGTGIPIIPESDVLRAKPKLLIILPWHFKKSFVPKLYEYVRDGGSVLFPLPEPFIMDINNFSDTLINST